MSILHLNQIKNHLKTEYDALINISDVQGGNETQNENFFLTRSLAAYSIQYHAEISKESAANSIVDGGDDNGIDAIHYNTPDRTLYISQSKWIHSGTGEPENGDVKKFLSGIKDLFNLNFDRFNEKIQAKKELISKTIIDPHTQYQIILTYTGINDLAEHSSRDINDFLEEINDASEKVYFSVFNQRPLHASLISDVTGSPIDLTITLKGWGKVHEPHTSFYGQVNGQEVYDWWQNNRTQLFRANIRGVLGDTSVNSEIMETLNDRPNDFWYFNNGVTILCDEAKKNMVGGSGTDYGQFTCTNISIVNGAQTVSCIGKFGEINSEALEHVFVPLRIISLAESNELLGEEITKANNRQNKVEASDFVSFDPEHIRLRDELAIEGINYQLNRSESVTRDETSFDLVEATTALACASQDVSVVVQLKREIGKIWDNLNTTPYKILYNPTIPGCYLYNCVMVQRKIEESMESKLATLTGRENGVMIHGNRIISMMIFKELNSNSLKSPEWRIEEKVTQDLIDQSIEKYFRSLYFIFDVEYSGSVIPTFFKNKSKCDQVVNLIPEFIDYVG